MADASLPYYLKKNIIFDYDVIDNAFECERVKSLNL